MSASIPVNNLSDFSVITIGTGTPSYSEDKANACTSIQYNGKYYIIDIGDGSYANLEASDFTNVKEIIGEEIFTVGDLTITTNYKE